MFICQQLSDYTSETRSEANAPLNAVENVQLMRTFCCNFLTRRGETRKRRSERKRIILHLALKFI